MHRSKTIRQVKIFVCLATAISLALPPPAFSQNHPDHDQRHHLRAAQVQDDPNPQTNPTFAGLEEALRRAGQEATPSIKTPAPVTPARIAPPAPVTRTFWQSRGQEVISNRPIAPASSRLAAAGMEEYPPELLPQIDVNEPGVSESLDQLRVGLLNALKSLQTLSGDLSGLDRVDLSKLYRLARSLRDFNVPFSEEDLRSTDAEGAITFYDELNRQIFVPAGEVLLLEQEGSALVLDRWRIRGNWQPHDYLGETNAFWSAEFQHMEGPHVAAALSMWGRYAFVDPEVARSEVDPYGEAVFQRQFYSGSLIERIGQAVSVAGLNRQEFGKYFGEWRVRHEEIQHAQDIIFAKKRWEQSRTEGSFAGSFEAAQGLLKPGSPLRREFLDNPAVIAGGLRAQATEFIGEASGKLGGLMTELDTHLEMARRNPTYPGAALAYARFLHEASQWILRVEELQGGRGRASISAMVSVRRLKQLGDMGIQPTEDGIIRHIEEGVRQGDYGTLAQRARVVLQKIYEQDFWWSEQDRLNAPPLTAGLEEPKPTSASQPIDVTLIPDPYDRYQTLLAIARIQMQAGQFEEALVTIGKISGYRKEKILAEIALAQARAGQDPTRALQVALASLRGGTASKSDPERLKVLSLVAQAQAQMGQFEEAKATARKARFLYQGAVEIFFDETPILAAIAQIEAEARKFDDALATLAPIPIDATHDGMDKIEGLTAIAQAQAKAGQNPASTFQEALEIAGRIRSAPGNLSLLIGLNALVAIAQAQAKAGQDPAPAFQEALAMVEEIGDASVMSSQLVDIALVQAQVGQDPTPTFQAALAAAREIFRNREGRSKRFAHIAVAQAQAGQFEAALATVREIQIDSDKVSALASIVAQARAEQIEAVLAIVRELPDSSHKGAALIAVVQALARAGQFDVAHTTAQGILYNFNKAPALAAIAKAQARAGQFEQALATSREVPYADKQVDALTAIAEAQARAGQDPATVFEEALDIARALSPRDGKFEQLAKVSTAQAQAGYIKAALATAGEIPEKQIEIKSKTLASIVLAQAQFSVEARSTITAQAAVSSDAVGSLDRQQLEAAVEQEVARIALILKEHQIHGKVLLGLGPEALASHGPEVVEFLDRLKARVATMDPILFVVGEGASRYEGHDSVLIAKEAMADAVNALQAAQKLYDIERLEYMADSTETEAFTRKLDEQGVHLTVVPHAVESLPLILRQILNALAGVNPALSQSSVDEAYGVNLYRLAEHLKRLAQIGA